MINIHEVLETNDMIEKENLDVRTITLGISLLDCIDSDLTKLCDNVYKKITTMAKDLVATGEEIGKEFGGRDHSTVLHAYNKIKNMIAQDDSLRIEIDTIKNKIK